MDTSISLLLTAFTVSLLHTLIPSHWLCFVLIGRSHGWTRRRTMTVAAVAGAVHVLMTLGAGIALAKLGRSLIGDPHRLEQLGGWMLVGLGGLYLVLHLLHGGHHHEADASVGDRAMLWTFLLALTFSPCSAAIPILVTQTTTWLQIAVIGLVLLATTIGNTLLMVGLASLGVEKLQFRFFDRYEKLILGLALAAGGALILLGHAHHS